MITKSVWTIGVVVLTLANTTIAGWQRAPNAQPWRLRYIDLDLRIDPAQRTVSGVARLDVTSTTNVSGDLVIELADAMSVDSAAVTSLGARDTAISGVREPGHVRFAIRSAAANTRRRVSVWYHGQPVRRAIGFSEHAGNPRAASYGLPGSAREWWPTLDEPSQKADSADIRITAPSKSVVASNGRFIGRSPSTDGLTTTTHWAVRHPIYPDVVSFALADYAVSRDVAQLNGGRRVPLERYVFVEDSVKGAADLAPLASILRFYDDALGPYPFGDEKYAIAEFARPSFREGQTITHLGASFFTGTGTAEQTIAHEVAHQWFGNSLSVRRWDDMWLNESLSEFMSWEWIRRAHGDAAYQVLLDSAVGVASPKAIVPADAADLNSLFGVATFVKGPVVISMLREAIGEKAFTSALRQYVADHAYGSVETADFQRACEQASGKTLDWFFQQWVYGNQLPRIKLVIDSGSRTHAAVTIQQLQPGPAFRMPIHLRITTADHRSLTRDVWVSKREERIDIPDVTGVIDVAIDHRRQLLQLAP